MNTRVMRYTPSKYRFALPNQIWAWKLKPPAFAVLAYLCWLHGHGGSNSVPEAGILAMRLHMSTAMTAACLDDLIRRGLIAQDFAPTLPHDSKGAGCFFTLPNEIFYLELGHGTITVYAYLLCCEDRRTHQCHPSYSTISSATGLAVNTVMKHVTKLADRRLITVERTSYMDDKGMKWNGNNCYTILPIRTAVDAFHQKQMDKLVESAEQQQIAAFLAAQRQPPNASCAPL